MAHDPVRQKAMRLLRLPCVKWEEALRRVTDDEWQHISSCLDGLAVRAAMLREYGDCRRGGYCGDHKEHGTAVTYSLRTRRAVRKALGFTTPKAGEFRF